MPSISCSSCGKRYSIPDGAAGKKFQCKQCGASIRVPAAVAAADPANPPAAVVATKQAAPPPLPRKPAPVATADPADVDIDAMAALESTGEVDNTLPFIDPAAAARPAKSARVANAPKAAGKRSLPRIGFRFNRLILALIIGGGMLAVAGGREWLLASGASDVPQDISCADLSANGPGNNAHVRISNFYCGSGFVIQKDENSGEWKTVWYTLIPRTAFKLKPFEVLKTKVVPDTIVDSSLVHILVKTSRPRSKEDVEAAMNSSSVEGLVINKIESLTDDERNLLHEKYPAMSEANCYIVEEGRQPKGGMGAMMILGGALLCVLGLGLMFKPR